MVANGLVAAPRDNFLIKMMYERVVGKSRIKGPAQDHNFSAAVGPTKLFLSVHWKFWLAGFFSRCETGFLELWYGMGAMTGIGTLDWVFLGHSLSFPLCTCLMPHVVLATMLRSGSWGVEPKLLSQNWHQCEANIACPCFNFSLQTLPLSLDRIVQ